MIYFKGLLIFFEGQLIWLNVSMTRNEFKNIITRLSITVILPPYFNDKFFDNIHIIFSWKYHMKDVLIPFWVSCLDQSIYIQNRIFTITGWMCVPWKPYTKVN